MLQKENLKKISEINYELTAKHRMEEFQNIGFNIGNSGWTLPMDLTPADTKILNDNLNEIDDILFSYYNKEDFLQKMETVILSSKYLKENTILIKQIFIAYRQELYSICIAAVVPIIENLFANFTNQKNNINFKEFIKNIRNQIKEVSIIESAALGALESFINSFSKKTDFSQEQTELTRNNICHGRIEIPNSRIEAMRYIANLYNLSFYFNI